MRSSRNRKVRFSLILAGFIFISLPSVGQKNETGLYPVYNFSPKQYNALEQNWCAVQDQRGIMYFGNTKGILEYDGVYWNLFPPVSGSPIHSLAVDKTGRLFFGSVGEFGYLEPDSTGSLEQVFLSDQLNDSLSFNEVWETYLYRNGIIFQSYHYLFYWKDDSIRIIHSEEEINETFKIGEDLFVSYNDTRLGLLKNDQIIPINKDRKISSSRICGMLEIRPGRVLLATEVDGFYALIYPVDHSENSKVRKIFTDNDNLFSSLDIFNLEMIDSDRISLGTWGYGSVIIDTTFNIIAIIDKAAGLQDQIIQGQYLDKIGNLWLALSSGISRVEIKSETTDFDDNMGLEGTVQDITRFNDNIFATTNIGLFIMEQKPYNQKLSSFSKPHFRLLEDFDTECWDMLTFKKGDEELLLVITNDDIFEINQKLEKNKVFSGIAYTLFQSEKDPARVYIGLESGLTSIYRERGKWMQEDSISDITEMITNMCEDSTGNLWLGTQEEGVLKLDFQDERGSGSAKYELKKYGREQGLSDGPFIVTEVKNNTVIASDKGLYTYMGGEDNFKPDSTFGTEFTDGSLYIHRIRNDKNDRIYMVTISQESGLSYEVGYLQQEDSGSYAWTNEPFIRISGELIHAIYLDKGDVVWMGGSNGLFRFSENHSLDYSQEFNTLIRSVEASEKGKLFEGSFSDDNKVPSLLQHKYEKYILPYAENSLVFTYAAQPGYAESYNMYSYILEGNDKSWSDWTKESKKEYTNLREGKYKFKVKAKNIYDQVSSEAIYEFTILAPWYRKFWAFIMYFIFAAVIVYAIVIVYTRRLRQIIRERTAEVVEQKEVIEVKNRDILDSILYAEKIQRAILPPEDDLGKLDLNGFVLFLPRDIVSGDFYWMGKKDEKIVTAAADCTGHGVPGAFLSMLGVSFLNNIVGTKGILNASEILNALRDEIIAALKQKGQAGEQKDGMDLSLCVIDPKRMKLEYAGANNPLIMVRDNEIIQFKADRMPIGIHDRASEPFQNNKIDLLTGDVLYTFSDGFQDQFGGPDNKKFMIKKLKELFVEIHKKPLNEQKKILEKAFNDWTEPYGVEQIDDVLVIGIRI